MKLRNWIRRRWLWLRTKQSLERYSWLCQEGRRHDQIRRIAAFKSMEAWHHEARFNYHASNLEATLAAIDGADRAYSLLPAAERLLLEHETAEALAADYRMRVANLCQ